MASQLENIFLSSGIPCGIPFFKWYLLVLLLTLFGALTCLHFVASSAATFTATQELLTGFHSHLFWPALIACGGICPTAAATATASASAAALVSAASTATAAAAASAAAFAYAPFNAPLLFAVCSKAVTISLGQDETEDRRENDASIVV